MKKRAKNGQQKQAPWINLSALKAVRRKYHAWKRFQTTQCHQMYLKYVKERRKATNKLKKAKRNFEEKLAAECDKNPKAFYSYANSYKKSLPPLYALRKNSVKDYQKLE